MGSIERIVSLILFGLIHVLAVSSIIGMVIFIVGVITGEDDGVERLLRAAAAAAGLLIYLGGRAYGLSIPDLMASALEVTKPLIKDLVSIVAPLASGSFVAFFCIQTMKRDSDIGARGIVLFSALVFTMFSDTYAVLASQATPNNLALALPNITFVLGVILYSIFSYKTGY
ncbi:MAG: hypothetical protein GXY76_22725 [Chloroflexi bacterium]|nr:hypothetical protein [Chloroflexota bacterium]